MTSRDFVYWLQGYFELTPVEGGLTPQQAKCIERHLAMVFIHEIDPSAGPPEKQAKLDEAHRPPPTTGVPPGPVSGGTGGNPFGPVFRC